MIVFYIAAVYVTELNVAALFRPNALALNFQDMTEHVYKNLTALYVNTQCT